MKLLEEKILSEGKALNKDILKVDSFINHQVDPVLMAQMGRHLPHILKAEASRKWLPSKVLELLLHS